MRRSRSDRRVLDEAGGARPMTWVMAIMVFLTMLAAALGLGTAQATRALDRQMAGRLTVQVVEGDAARRDALAARVLAAVHALPEVSRAVPVDRAELTRLLRPWLGADGADPELPVPAMIDVDLKNAGEAGDGAAGVHVARIVHGVSASARTDAHERWMSPVGGFMRTMTLLATTLVLLMAGATAAVVVLAARAGLETHRATIEVMHMLGSTDVQVARLFQRRVAMDAAIGGVVGGACALAVIAVLGVQGAALGSELLGSVSLMAGGWVALACLPVGFVVLATLVARRTVLSALRRTL